MKIKRVLICVLTMMILLVSSASAFTDDDVATFLASIVEDGYDLSEYPYYIVSSDGEKMYFRAFTSEPYVVGEYDGYVKLKADSGKYLGCYSNSSNEASGYANYDSVTSLSPKVYTTELLGCSFDLKYEDGSVFGWGVTTEPTPTPLPNQPQAQTWMGLTKESLMEILKELKKIIPGLLVCLIGLIGFWKAWNWLKQQLQIV